MLTLREPSSFADLACVRLLFEEYRTWLGIDLGFQKFDEELASLPGDYGRPRGRLWLAMMGAEAAGCAGIRPFGQGDCEMKRLYVRPGQRGKGVGKRLAATAIEVAKQIGYRRMYLDTLASMTDATRLYRSLGFQETEPYTYNPYPNVLYFALDLTAVPSKP
jgi:GNAT superfamily N-acetyltransferase